jgi:hypothetical protein
MLLRPGEESTYLYSTRSLVRVLENGNYDYIILIIYGFHLRESNKKY